MSGKTGERKTLPLDVQLMKPGSYMGMIIPECYEPVSEHLPKVKAMPIRDDDVVLCSYPKSGTHWMYRMLDLLIRRQLVYDVRNADSTYIDVQHVDKMADLDSPRILVTHLPFDLLPSQIKNKRTKIVHVYRNPKAVAVSLHFQMRDATLDESFKNENPIQAYAELFLAEKVPYGGWFSYKDKVTEYQSKNPDVPLFNVSYEEMTQNPLETVKGLAKFLGVSVSDEFCRQVVDACSFQKQKATEEENPQQAALKFFRKGDMDDWKNHLTVSLNERFDAAIKERAKRCFFSAKYVT
nr:hypothetical protein BaRGS_032021 [Batillaria attramentaria]